MLLELFARGCQVGLTCQKKCDPKSDTQEISLLSLESLGCHPRRVDGEWWGIYTFVSHLNISLWDK
jgi:hypothetical protein